MKTLTRIFLMVVLAVFALDIAHAQNTRKEKQIAEIKNMVDENHYIFAANYVNPQRGAGRALTSEYYLTVSKDSVRGYLPYFGRAFVAPLNPDDGPIDFTTANFDYNKTEGKKGGWEVTIKPKERNIIDIKDVQTLRLNISKDGFATLQVISTNRDPISFNGIIESKK